MDVDHDPGEVTEFNELDASSHEERVVKVTTSIPGFMEGEQLGLCSSDLTTRRRTIYAMYRVMCGWTRMPLISMRSAEMLEKLAPGSLSATYDTVEEAEFHLAYYYVDTFADFVKRAPVLPCVSIE